MRISVITRTLEVSKSRIPLIKFRGGLSGHSNDAPAHASKSGSKASTKQTQTYEDFQLPLKFRRQVLDDREIDAINSGGAF